VVPSLALSVPSIIANSSSSDHPVVTRSRSDADGEEPISSPPTASPVLHSFDDTNRTAIRQPADGLGNPSTTNALIWRTSNTNEERRLMSWSSNDEEDEDDDDDVVPPSSRLRPVLIGGEDNTQYHHSDDEDTLLTNLSLTNHN
jgi:hypothetical protein